MKTFTGRSSTPVASKMLPITVTYYLKLLPITAKYSMLYVPGVLASQLVCPWYSRKSLKSSKTFSKKWPHGGQADNHNELI